MSFWLHAAFLLLVCAGGGMIALNFGFALEWDLLNYHFYNPHALLNGRLATDIAPAQLQSFLNPGLHLPIYLSFRHLGPEPTVFILAALQSAQVLLLYLLAREVAGKPASSPFFLVPVALLGLAGPIFINQLGGSQGDTLLSIPVLGGLLVLVRDFRRPSDAHTLKAGLLAGVLLGAAGALKLTMLLYAVALGAAAFLCFSGRGRWRVTAGLAAGGLAGFLLAGGPWFYHQWQAYGNPLLPYFNNLFGSEWVGPSSHRDMRFMPSGALQWIFYPWYWLTDSGRVWEYAFRDIRVPLMLLAVFTVPLFAWRKMRATMPALGLVWLFVAFSYLLWLGLFSIYRYLSVLELLAPLMIFLSLALFGRSKPQLLLALALVALTQFEVEYHRNPATWELHADTPTEMAKLPPGSLVIAGGYQPTAYAAIWLDDQVPLIRFRSNFMRDNTPRFGLHRLAWERIQAHRGSTYLLLTEWDRDDPVYGSDLEALGYFKHDADDCVKVIRSNDLQKQLRPLLCRLERKTDANQDGGR